MSDEGIMITPEMKAALKEGVQKAINIESDISDSKEDLKALYEQMKDEGVDVAGAKFLVKYLIAEEKNPGAIDRKKDMEDTLIDIWYGKKG